MHAKNVVATALAGTVLSVLSCGAPAGVYPLSSRLVAAQVAVSGATPSSPVQLVAYGFDCSVPSDCDPAILNHAEHPAPACTEYFGVCSPAGKCALRLRAGAECLSKSVWGCVNAVGDTGVLICSDSCAWAPSCQRCGHAAVVGSPTVPAEPCCMGAKCFGATSKCVKGTFATGVCQ
jgi:hypothetical protein